MKKVVLLICGVSLLASACALIDERYAGPGVWLSPSYERDEYYGDRSDVYEDDYFSFYPYPYQYPWSFGRGFGWYSWNPFFYMDPNFYLWSFSTFGYYGYYPYSYFSYYPSRFHGGYGWSGSGYGRVDRYAISKDSLRRLGSTDGTVRRIRKTPSPASSSRVLRSTATRSSSSGRSGTIRSSGSGRSSGTARSSGGSRSSGGTSSGGSRSAGGGSIRKK